MRYFTALVLALAATLGLTACAVGPVTAPTVATGHSVPYVLPDASDTITAPVVTLTYERVTVETTSATTPTACLEDMPCWSCETMGNQICGNTTPEMPTALTRDFVLTYPVFYSPTATCPLGTAQAMDNLCLPLHYWNLSATIG